MLEDRTFVIAGAGLAGAKAAATLREEGFSGRIALIGTEPEIPYERPPLSKGLLLGTAQRDDARVHDPDWYAAHDVDLRTATTVNAIDAEKRRVRLSDGDDLAYDKLLLATGASPRTLGVPGAGLGTCSPCVPWPTRTGSRRPCGPAPGSWSSGRAGSASRWPPRPACGAPPSPW